MQMACIFHMTLFPIDESKLAEGLKPYFLWILPPYIAYTQFFSNFAQPFPTSIPTALFVTLIAPHLMCSFIELFEPQRTCISLIGNMWSFMGHRHISQ